MATAIHTERLTRNVARLLKAERARSPFSASRAKAAAAADAAPAPQPAPEDRTARSAAHPLNEAVRAWTAQH
jgi:hypothetical protein